MLNLNLNNKRINQRYRLSGLLPGKVIVLSSGSFLSARPIDVSRNGIGVLSNYHLQLEEKLVMQYRQYNYFFKVHHIKKDYAKSNLYRYGLIIDQSVHASNFNSKHAKDDNNFDLKFLDKYILPKDAFDDSLKILGFNEINLRSLFENSGCLSYDLNKI